MKRWLSLALMCLVIALSSGILTADEPVSADDRWFWAWREATGDVIAYNLQGDANTILTDVQSSNDFQVVSGAIRVDQSRMLAVLKVNDDEGLYRLDGASATLIDLLNHDPATLGIYGYEFVYSQVPYVVMVGHNDFFYLINVDTGVLTTFLNGSTNMGLSCFIWGMGNTRNRCMGISKDGTKLRYILDKSGDYEHPLWSLVERDLATGAENEFLTVDGTVPPFKDATVWKTNCVPDSYGERWLCSIYAESPDNGLMDYFMVYPDGQKRMLVEHNPYFTVAAFISYDDEVVVDNPYTCHTECYLEIYPSDEGEPYRFVYKGGLAQSVSRFRRFDNSRIMLQALANYYTLAEHGESVYTGQGFCCGSSEVVSPDLRWLVSSTVTGTEEHLYLWDMAEGRRVLRLDDDVYPSYDQFFTEYGLIVDGNWIYRFGDEAALDIPDIYTGTFFNVLADGTLLYSQTEATESLEEGIYRYNPETDAMTLLLGGATPIFQEQYNDRRP